MCMLKSFVGGLAIAVGALVVSPASASNFSPDGTYVVKGMLSGPPCTATMTIVVSGGVGQVTQAALGAPTSAFCSEIHALDLPWPIKIVGTNRVVIQNSRLMASSGGSVLKCGPGPSVGMLQNDTFNFNTQLNPNNCINGNLSITPSSPNAPRLQVVWP